MLDNQLFRMLFAILNNGFAAIGQSSIKMLQSYQPTQEGANTSPSIYMYKIGPDRRWGSPARISMQGIGTASFNASVTGSTLSVGIVTTGQLDVNQLVTGAGLPGNILITGFGMANGETGTYNLNYAPGDLAAEDMTSAGTWVYTETQQYLSTFQCSALATQNPSVDSLTASDIANLAAYVLQSQPAIDALEAVGVGILNIRDVRNPYFSDDRQRYEASPSFDFTLSHKQTIITTTPFVSETDFQIYSV